MMRGLIGAVTVIALLASGLSAFGASPVLIGHKWDSPTTPANGEARAAATTPDGRYVLFQSEATDLVSADTNGTVTDMFLYDRIAGTVEMIVPTANGVQPNVGCYAFSITPDLRYVGFGSEADDLVPGVEGDHGQAYVYDRETGSVELASVADDGTPGNGGPAAGGSMGPLLSTDGRYACFASYATDLVPGDTNDATDIFVQDRRTGHTERVSVASDGAQSNGGSLYPSMTPDGRYVTFASEASNLVPGDTNGCPDSFVHDRVTGRTERVNLGADGAQASWEGSLSVAPISGDGRFVAFHSNSDSLVTGDTNGQEDSFVRDRAAGATELVSHDTTGAQFTHVTWPTSISADGRFVGFYGIDGGERAYLRDRNVGVTIAPPMGGISGPISANGRVVLLGARPDVSSTAHSLYLWEPELVEFGTIHGMVTESDSGEPVAGAHVWIGGTLMTVTDVDGNYSIEVAVTGDTSVKAEMEGYAEAVEEGVAVTAGGTTEVDLVLHVQPFPDVEEGSWAASSIAECVSAGIVGGYDDGLYHGDEEVTRDQMAVYIARGVAGGDENVPEGPGTASFVDVPNTGYGDGGTDPHWAYKYVEYAVDSNVVQGYDYDDPENPGETIYRYEPTWTVTRDQMAVYMARAMVAPTGEAALADYVPADPRDFPDVPSTGYGDDGTDPFWAYRHIEYCVENGVVSGYDDGYYRPEWIVTRDQMAVYVARAFGLGG